MDRIRLDKYLGDLGTAPRSECKRIIRSGRVCVDGAAVTAPETKMEELQRMGLFPVGRLDRDTRGLLLLTDDGDFAHRVISPKFAVEKLYDACVEGTPDESDAEAFAEGLVLGDGTKCRPARLEILGEGRCLVTVTEGKYHQVKRMLASRGKPVTALKRLSVGALHLPETLPEGAFVELDDEDLCRVFMVR